MSNVIITAHSQVERQLLNDEYTALIGNVHMSIIHPQEWDARLTQLHHELSLDSTWSSNEVVFL